MDIAMLYQVTRNIIKMVNTHQFSVNNRTLEGLEMQLGELTSTEHEKTIHP